MRTQTFSRYALTSCAAAALLAGCGGSQAGMSGAMPQRTTPLAGAHGRRGLPAISYTSRRRAKTTLPFTGIQGTRCSGPFKRLVSDSVRMRMGASMLPIARMATFKYLRTAGPKRSGGLAATVTPLKAVRSIPQLGILPL